MPVLNCASLIRRSLSAPRAGSSANRRLLAAAHFSASGFAPNEHVAVWAHFANDAVLALPYHEMEGSRGSLPYRKADASGVASLWIMPDPLWPRGDVLVVAHGLNTNHEATQLINFEGAPRRFSVAGLLAVARTLYRPLLQKISRQRSGQVATSWGQTPVNASPSDSPPTASIVIPVYNGLHYTQKCLDGIFTSRVNTHFEIIVVNNGSSDGTSEWLRSLASSQPTLKYIDNPSNLGFGQAINQGAKISRGKYIVIANNDMLVTPGWLDGLIQAAESNPAVGMVSPVTNYSGESDQLEREAANLRPDQAVAYAQRLRVKNGGLRPVVDRLAFFCVLVKREVFEKLEGLADAFALGNLEDDDFCLRARLAGYQLAVVSNVFVFHYGNRTFVEQNISVQEWLERNRKIFYERVARYSTQFPPRPRKNSEPPRVSVLIHGEHHPALLHRALASLANQTLRHFEVIVVGDSQADLSNVCYSFSDYLKIRCVSSPEQRSYSAAFNSALHTARGQWISYLNDDQLLYPTHLEHLLAALTQTPDARVAYSDLNKVLCAGRDKEIVLSRFHAPSFEFEVEELLVDDAIPLVCIMHSSKCFDQVGWFDESLDLLGDWEFVIRLAQATPFQHVRRITSEHRFGLGKQLDTAISTQPLEIMEAMRRVFKKHPVQALELERRRDDRLASLIRQADDLRQINQFSQDDTEKAYLTALRALNLKF